jgi:hypothetical protein
MLPYRLVYHEGYDLRLGEHVFPAQKYRYIHDRLLRDGFATAEDFVRPEPAADADILAVHEPGWVQRLQTGTLSYQEVMRLEVPYSRELVEAFWLAAGGSMLAARLALGQGIGFNVGGGFHHAFAGHGEGFCAINDIAVAIRAMQRGGCTTEMEPRAFSRATHPCSRCPFISSTITPRKSRLPASTFTCLMAWATKSICTGWAMDIARRWPCFIRSC